MSIFDFFQKKRGYEQELAILYGNEKYEQVISRATEIFGDNKNIPLNIKKIVALSYYYTKDYANSLILFEQIALKNNDVASWFNVLTSLFPLNKTQQAKEVFNKILKMHKGAKSTGTVNHFLPQLCVPYIRYYYACGLAEAGLFEDSFEQLNELKQVYIKTKITDDTFLYMRGIPFLSSFLEVAKKVCAGLNITFSTFLQDLESQIDDDGKALIKRHQAN